MNSIFKKANFTSFVEEIWLLASFFLTHSCEKVIQLYDWFLSVFWVPGHTQWQKAFVSKLQVSPYGDSFKALQDRLQRKQTLASIIFLTLIHTEKLMSYQLTDETVTLSYKSNKYFKRCPSPQGKNREKRVHLIFSINIMRPFPKF